MDKLSVLGVLKDNLAPNLLREIEASLPDDFALSDNQNQNQGSLEEISRMKPEILREVGIGSVGGGEEVMDNQNQNQGKMEELLAMKPAALQNLKTVLMGGGEEVMDNQNQNQGSSEMLAEGSSKPRRLRK
ncbi:hypothetical protein [Ruegeria arenilitoris]|uniref:hypothetical protein n=1 Tax=Ruegeria arenilitoris TaxID=1173585 RepID=UPI00147A6EF9|nr:hypothetical protein [Ruegeria arenilitoris]